MMNLHAFVINLPSAVERLRRVTERLDAAGIPHTRVEGVYGPGLVFPHPDFAARRYTLWHGKEPNPREVGCYLGHIAAIRAFLESNAEYGLMLEDDADFAPELPALLKEAITARDTWDLLHLSHCGRIHPSTFVTLRTLSNNARIAQHLTHVKGAGAYLVNRRWAKAAVNALLPMWLPWDYAFDREEDLPGRFRVALLLPFPVSQATPDVSQITQTRKLGFWRRSFTVMPRRTFERAVRFVRRLAVAMTTGRGR
jgi:glycosyl transferase family 25